jgi:hypothetical protein
MGSRWRRRCRSASQAKKGREARHSSSVMCPVTEGSQGSGRDGGVLGRKQGARAAHWSRFFARGGHRRVGAIPLNSELEGSILLGCLYLRGQKLCGIGTQCRE